VTARRGWRSCLAIGACASLLAEGSDARPLEALIFLNDPAQAVREAPASPGRPIDATRVPALDTPQARKVIEPFLGQEIEPALLEKLRNALQRYFGSINQPFVAVSIPNQTASAGTLQVVTLVSRLGKLGVEGNQWFDERQYLGSIRLRPGDPVDRQVLADDIAWINRNPYRRASPVASPGEQLGTTDLVIHAQDQRPLAFNASVDNTGTPATGRQRFGVGVEWGNALWRGDLLSYNFLTSANRESVRVHSVAYTAFLPWRDQVTFSGTTSDTRSADPASPLGNSGSGVTAGARYRHALQGNATLEHSLIAAFDFKRTNNNTLFGGASVFATNSEIDQFTLGYAATFSDPSVRTSVDLSGIASPGGITGNNTDAAFSAQRPGATAKYALVRAAVDRVAQLQGGWSWDLRGSLQASNRNLLASEQFVLGGSRSIRGFQEFAAVRDSGYLVNVELRAPGFATPAGARIGADQLAPFLFTDFGGGRNHDELGGPNSTVRLWSAGGGLRYQAGTSVSAQLSLGLVLDRAGLVSNSRGAVHFSLQANF
jgi:hemolysin activation/secretion protein